MRTAKIGPDLRLSPDTKVGQTGEKDVFSNKNGYVWTGPQFARVLKTHDSYCSYQMHVVIVVVVVLSIHVVDLFTLLVAFVFLGSNEPGSL